MVDKIAPRKGYRMRHEALEKLGPLFLALTGKTIEVDGKRLDFKSILSDGELLGVFFRDCMAHIMRTGPDDVFDFMARLCDGIVTVEVEDEDEGTRAIDLVGVEDDFDHAFEDHSEMELAFWEVLVFTFRPTFPVSLTNGGLVHGKQKSQS